MDKKFFKASLFICLPIIFLLGIFTFSLKDANEYNWDTEDMYTVKYKDYKSNSDSHIITVTFKNNTNNIASLSDLRLSFEYIGESNNVGNFYFEGEEEGNFDGDYVYGIDGGKERDIIFKIPKSIKIDESQYNTKSIDVNCMAQFYKFRKGKNSLLFLVCSSGGETRIKKTDV